MMAGATVLAVAALGCFAGFSSKTVKATATDAVSRSITYSYGQNAGSSSGTSFEATSNITNKGSGTRIVTNVSCHKDCSLSFSDSNYYCVTKATYLYDTAVQGSLTFKAQVLNLSSINLSYYIGSTSGLAAYAHSVTLYSESEWTGNSKVINLASGAESGTCSHSVTTDKATVGFSPKSFVIKIPYVQSNGTGNDVTIGLTSLALGWSC